VNAAGSFALLEVKGLRKDFEARRSLIDLLRGRHRRILTAVNDVSFQVTPGETLGIVGESGCGKSTLARCLVRLLEPDDGALRFEGEDVLALRQSELRRYNRKVQMIFQDPYGSLDPRQKAGDCLAEILFVHGLAETSEIAARTKRLLDLVHLPADAADRYPHEFSGGQRQRLGIARALAVEPTLVIADEPVSALDVSVQAQIVNLLIELQSRLGLTLIFISHDLRVVRHISHRIVVMYLGRIIEMGPSESVFAAPRHPYTQALLQALPSLSAAGRKHKTRAAVRGELPSPIAPPPGCPFHPRCPIAAERCKSERPELDPRDGEWPVACHFPDRRLS
jgi:oligopeptide/dipeptide ABC transporter ATP-binding protein